MSTFVLNILPNRNFGDAIAVQDLRRIQYEIFFDVPLEPKSWSLPCIQYSIYQGRNQLGGRGGRPPSIKLGPSVKCGCLSLQLGVNVRNEFCLQLNNYHNTSKVSLIIINTINIDIKLKLQKLIQLTFFPKYFKIFLKFHLNFLKLT